LRIRVYTYGAHSVLNLPTSPGIKRDLEPQALHLRDGGIVYVGIQLLEIVVVRVCYGGLHLSLQEERKKGPSRFKVQPLHP